MIVCGPVPPAHSTQSASPGPNPLLTLFWSDQPVGLPVTMEGGPLPPPAATVCSKFGEFDPSDPLDCPDVSVNWTPKTFWPISFTALADRRFVRSTVTKFVPVAKSALAETGLLDAPSTPVTS